MNLFDSRGYVLLRRIRVAGARVHVHWLALALGGVVLGVFIRQPLHAAEAVACYFGLILLHEVGHVLVARRLGYAAPDIYLGAIHGFCVHDHPDTFREDALIAWGGVLAQLAVAVPLLALDQIPGFSSLPFVGLVVVAFGYFSLPMVAFNLVPSHGLDGAKAWRLIPLLFSDLRAGAKAKKATRDLMRRLK